MRNSIFRKAFGLYSSHKKYSHNFTIRKKKEDNVTEISFHYFGYNTPIYDFFSSPVGVTLVNAKERTFDYVRKFKKPVIKLKRTEKKKDDPRKSLQQRMDEVGSNVKSKATKLFKRKQEQENII